MQEAFFAGCHAVATGSAARAAAVPSTRRAGHAPASPPVRIASDPQRRAPDRLSATGTCPRAGRASIRAPSRWRSADSAASIAGARRGGGQAEQGPPLRIIQLAFRRHGLGGIVGQRPLRRRPVVGPFQDRCPRLIGGGAVQRAECSERTIVVATPRVGRRDQEGAPFRKLGGEIGSDRSIERGQRPRGVTLAEPQGCQSRAESRPGPRRISLPASVSPAQVRHASAESRATSRSANLACKSFAIGAGRQQVGVLLHQRHQLQRSQHIRRIVAQQRGEHVGQFGVDCGLVVREQRLAFAQQGQCGTPSPLRALSAARRSRSARSR